MAEWSKALDLSSSIRKNAWVRTPLEAPIFLEAALSRECAAPRAAGLGQERAASITSKSSWPNG